MRRVAVPHATARGAPSLRKAELDPAYAAPVVNEHESIKWVADAEARGRSVAKSYVWHFATAAHDASLFWQVKAEPALHQGPSAGRWLRVRFMVPAPEQFCSKAALDRQGAPRE